ncbi:E3 SUMO-protein ligase PIAS2-like [Palaemon carinicauda]|uniref:E3 SUMO-protein ligase PIAS2-like n=1 Tax=Palaemon carinicauda TaxID=392227 RepID=UPI0035B58DDA
MAMSWGFTPLCRVGNDRYRLAHGASESGSSVGPISSTQCGVITPHQLPRDTSIVLATGQQDSATSQPRPPSPGRPPVSSASLSGSETSSIQSVSSNHEDRVVRRSPRLAQASRVTYRDDGDTQGGRRRNLWGTRVQEMWNNERNQTNASQQSNPNYSVYNYDGQVTPCVNASNSLSVIYNNKHAFSNMSSLLRYPPTIPFAKPPNYPLNSVKVIPKDVTIKSLDFYEVVTTLVQKEIIPEGMRAFQETYSFVLKAEDAKNLLDKRRKPPYLIQLRFCKLDGSGEQNDYYPTSHQVAVNHRFVILPGLDTMPRGAMRPMDITHFCQLSSQACNFITLRCMESCKMFVYIVQKYTSDDLLSRLEKKPHIKEEDTVCEIKKKLQDDQADDGIAAATLQFSLLCPLSRLRIKLPCRASTCTHLQCFDAATYLKLNECKPKWSCPVCYQPALYKNLVIDGYFKKVIDDNIQADKIELQPDGTWTLVDAAARKKPSNGVEKVTENSSKDKSTDPADKTVTLDSDDDAPVVETSRKENRANTDPQVIPCQSNSPEIVTLSDDDSPTGDSPEVTGSTYPTLENSSRAGVAANAPNSGLNIPNDLQYFNNFWQGALGRISQQQLAETYGNLHPIDHSSLYIPLTRTPIPTLPSSLTITCMSNNEVRSSSGNRSRRSNDISKETQHISRSESRASKSKKKQLKKASERYSKKTSGGVTISKRKSGDIVVSKKKPSGVVKHKRKRILSVSSDSSNSDCDSRKKSKHKSARREPTKQKPKRKKRTSESSEGEKSSSSSTLSKTSNSSVNLISSSDGSGTDSASTSSSSSESSDNESEHSDDSFSVKDVEDRVEESSRVLRSALRRQTTRKK